MPTTMNPGLDVPLFIFSVFYSVFFFAHIPKGLIVLHCLRKIVFVKCVALSIYVWAEQNMSRDESKAGVSFTAAKAGIKE